MKSLVVYYSKTGNTKKIAEAIARGLKADLKRVEEVNNISEYNLICVGTPVYGFAPAMIVQNFLENIPSSSNKKGIGFCTMHAAGDKRTLRILKEKMEIKGIDFLGGFSCRGLSSIFANIGPKIFNRGKPNKKDLEKAEDFGRKILESQINLTYRVG